MQAVQPTDILGDRPVPGNRQCEKQRVQTRVVEAFADIASRGQQNARLVFGNRGEPRGKNVDFSSSNKVCCLPGGVSG